MVHADSVALHPRPGCNPKHAARMGHAVGGTTKVRGVCVPLAPSASLAGSSPFRCTRAFTMCTMAATALMSPVIAASHRANCRASRRAFSQVTKVGYRLGGLLPERLGDHVVGGHQGAQGADRRGGSRPS